VRHPYLRGYMSDFPDTTYGQPTEKVPAEYPRSADLALAEKHVIKRIAAWLEGQGPIGHVLATAVRSEVWR
jgi:hypothetical protein